MVQTRRMDWIWGVTNATSGKCFKAKSKVTDKEETHFLKIGRSFRHRANLTLSLLFMRTLF